MIEGWKTYKLGEVAKLRKETIRPDQFNGEKYIGLEHIGQGNFLLSGIGNASDATSNKSKFKSEDILYGKIRPYFKKVYKPKFSGICSTDILVINSSDESVITQEFLYQLIKTQEFTDKATETSSGTKMPRADWHSLAKLEYRLPPLQEQKQIASILSALDDKIELNLHTNKTLEEMAMALYKHWFVDFEPFQKGEFVDSELGLIPEGWEVKSIGNLVKDKSIASPKDGNHGGIHPKGKDFIDNGVPFITASDLKSGNIDFEKCSHISFEQAKTLKKGFSHEGDVLLTHKATIGRVCIVPNLNTDYIILTPQVTYYRILNKLQLSSEFLQYTFKSKRFQNDLNTRAQSGSTRAYLSITNQWDLTFIMPKTNIIQDYTKEVKNLNELQSVNRQENQSLTKLRDTLLPKLISGEVRVKKAEKILEEAFSTLMPI